MRSLWRQSGCGLCGVLALFLGGCVQVERWVPPRLEERAASGRGISLPEPPPMWPDQVALPDLPPRGEVWQLAVEEATLWALERNPDLRMRRLSPVVAGAYEEIARGAYDLELFAEARYGEESIEETARSTGTRFNVEGEDGTLEAGVRQALPTGGELEATISQRYDRSNRTPEQHETRLGISFTQALLRGFGPAVNLASVWQAERETVASQYELRAYTERMVAEVESAYWRYALAQEELRIFQSSLELARQSRDAIAEQIDVGLLAPTEGAAARAEVALREQALIDARSASEAARLELLTLLLGQAGAEDGWKLATATPVRLEPIELGPVSDSLALARRQRPDLGEARMQLEQRRLETVVTRNGLLPRLDFFASLGRSGFGTTSEASWDAVDGPSYDFRTGLSLSYHLGARSARGRDLVARAEQRRAEIAIENLATQIVLEVRLAANEVARAREQIAASVVSRELREEALRAEEERFDVGSSTALLVAQAQRDLLASQIAEIEAVVDYRLALIRLYLAEGSLLERRGLQLRALSAI